VVRDTETVYLPGDRETAELARIYARDRRPTAAEWRAIRLAYDCASDRMFYGERCSPGDPCRYCREIGSL
jgi:hypothetical protein